MAKVFNRTMTAEIEKQAGNVNMNNNKFIFAKNKNFCIDVRLKHSFNKYLAREQDGGLAPDVTLDIEFGSLFNKVAQPVLDYYLALELDIA